MKFKKLCLSGGGGKGFCQLGALKFCNDKQLLNDINTYAGTSIGSAIVVLLCAGYTPDDIYGHFLKQNFIPKTQDINPIFLFTRNGLIDSDIFAEELRILLKKRMDDVPTLKKFYEYTQKELFICSANVSTGEIVYFNHKTHPDLDVVEAVKMSCNLPIIFTRIKYNNEDYVDGGLVVHVPFEVLDDGEESVLSIVTSGIGIEAKIFGDAIDYLFKIMMMPIKQLEKFQRQKASDMCWFLDINTDDIHIFSVAITEQDKEKLWIRGYSTATKWFNTENIEDLKTWGWDDNEIEWDWEF